MYQHIQCVDTFILRYDLSVMNGKTWTAVLFIFDSQIGCLSLGAYYEKGDFSYISVQLLLGFVSIVVLAAKQKLDL